ncbi:hypothetical protein N7572_16730, partial [Enterobacter roggenkampii]
FYAYLKVCNNHRMKFLSREDFPGLVLDQASYRFDTLLLRIFLAIISVFFDRAACGGTAIKPVSES